MLFIGPSYDCFGEFCEHTCTHFVHQLPAACTSLHGQSSIKCAVVCMGACMSTCMVE